jgi:hypothetical protein
MGINTSFGAGGVKVSPKAVMPTTSDILGMMPQRFTQARPETAGMEELGTMIAPGLAKAATPVVKGGGNLLGMAMNERLLAGQPILPSLAKEPQSAMFAVQPIDLNKGIYKPELTMDEMLKVKDIPTVDRVKQSIDLVGEDQFKKMVNAQYQKYKPTDQDQEAMLVESVTLNILGKAQRNAEKTGLPTSITNKSEVKNVADDFANQFKQMGFEVTLDHSGSKAGASSYLRVSDPTTGRFLNKPIRISDHSKGAKELDANINVLNPQEDFAKITSILTDMRKMGATLVVKQDKYAQELIANGVNPKIAYQKAKTEITENKQ